jgi:hypothetical protein
MMRAMWRRLPLLAVCVSTVVACGDSAAPSGGQDAGTTPQDSATAADSAGDDSGAPDVGTGADSFVKPDVADTATDPDVADTATDPDVADTATDPDTGPPAPGVSFVGITSGGQAAASTSYKARLVIGGSPMASTKSNTHSATLGVGAILNSL